MSQIRLLGSSDSERRLQFLSLLLSQAEESAKHIDESRHRNLNYALLIFAGLFGLGIGVSNLVYQLSISVAIVIVMSIFCFWDRRLHRIMHGWRSSASILRSKITEVINHPDQDIEFSHYRIEGEKKAEWFSFMPVIFYILVLGGLVSFLVFRFLPA